MSFWVGIYIPLVVDCCQKQRLCESFNKILLFYFRIVVVGKSDRNVRVQVERLKGRGYRVEVGYQTFQMTNQESLYGIRINPALEGEDYQGNMGTLVFEENKQASVYGDIKHLVQIALEWKKDKNEGLKNISLFTLLFAVQQELKYVDISLTPATASANPLPKQFYVHLKAPTGGAR